MYCEMCGTQNDDSAKICKKCGYHFDGSKEYSKEDFKENTDKFIKDNYETIREKTIIEKTSQEAKKVVKTTSKIPLLIRVLICLVIIVGIGFGVKYYIETKDFFIEEKNPETGESYFIYKKNGYTIVDEPLFLRGNYYRVDERGHRIENSIYTDAQGNDYYYAEEGIMKWKEWFVLNGQKKYANDKGIIVKNDWHDDYYLDSNGNITIDSQVGNYYVNEYGKKVYNEWKNDHYFGGDGVMLRNTRTPDEKKLRVDKNGDIIYNPAHQVFSKNFRFGSKIIFGEFEQNGDESDGPEPIEWILMYGQQDKAYLLSKHVLFASPYQRDVSQTNGNTHWSNSYLRQWLHGYFFNKVFDDIDKTYVYMNDNDMISIPSAQEIDKFIPNERFRIGVPTEVAKMTTKYSVENKNMSIYWLRDDGKDLMHKSFISDVGDIISDDISDRISITNAIVDFDDTIKAQSSTFYEDDTNTITAFSSDLKSIAKGVSSELANAAVDYILPGWASKILGATGLTDKAVDALWDMFDPSSYNSSGSGKGPGDYIDENSITAGLGVTRNPIPIDGNKTLEQALATKMPEQTKPNPYKNVGLVTNELVGVRPIIYINMRADAEE